MHCEMERVLRVKADVRIASDVIQTSMQLTVVFEHWHLGDGNYPAFAVGQEARLSFELEVDSAELADEAAPDELRQLRDAEYEVVGRIIRQYPGAPVIESDWFRFYCPFNAAAADLPVGSRGRLRGRLALDHFQWVEFLDRYPDPPDLFYSVRVVRIRQVDIPERFIHRSEQTLSHPTVIGTEEYHEDDVREVEKVSDRDGELFSLLDLELLPRGAGPQRPTFIG
jgi:hypothetical protein